VRVEEQRVWAYLLNNRQATAGEVALNCDVSLKKAEQMIARISSSNWREEVSVNTNKIPSALDSQVGGAHYKEMAVQPWEALEAWLTPAEYRGYHKGVAISYLAREQSKGGMQDIQKAVHHLQRLIEMQGESDDRPNTEASPSLTSRRDKETS
jgi:hypothetical protein